MYRLKLKTIRKMKNISAKQISDALELTSPTMVYAWERGDKKISVENLIKVADICGVTLDEMVDRKVPDPLPLDIKQLLRPDSTICYGGMMLPDNLTQRLRNFVLDEIMNEIVIPSKKEK